jgi:hypothetical protein
MYGIDAISAQNGWAMIFTGAFIVLFGLGLLSIIISQLHRISDFYEKKGTKDNL